MRTSRRPRTRDLVEVGGQAYRIAAEALAPEPGFWVGPANGGAGAPCERFVARAAWSLVWNAPRQRWEPAQ